MQLILTNECLSIFKIREDIFRIPLKMILFGDLAFEIKLFYLYSHFLNIHWLFISMHLI